MNRKILKKEIRKILIKADPEYLYFPYDHNTDEYNSEEDLIIEQLSKISSREELLEKILEIFRKQFSYHLYGPKENYENIANDIWELVQRI